MIDFFVNLPWILTLKVVLCQFLMGLGLTLTTVPLFLLRIALMARRAKKRSAATTSFLRQMREQRRAEEEGS